MLAQSKSKLEQEQKAREMLMADQKIFPYRMCGGRFHLSPERFSG
jgi:hypothetical protein